MRISAIDVVKRFGNFTALDHVRLEVRSGELLALLGPSGSGKTTLLRIVAGLDWPDEGAVQFDGEDALSRPVGQRNVGFVFQHYALFRHMTVFENVAFGLRAKPRHERLSEPEIRDRVERIWCSSVGWRSAIRRNFPAANASVSRSPGRSPLSRVCSCLTNRSVRSTPRCARI